MICTEQQFRVESVRRDVNRCEGCRVLETKENVVKLLQDEVGEVKCGGRGDVVKVCEEGRGDGGEGGGDGPLRIRAHRLGD